MRQGFGLTCPVQSPVYADNPAINWFHVAIPTPVIVEDKRATLRRVHYLYRTFDGAELIKVYVYDGQAPILPNHGLDGSREVGPHSGDHTGTLDAANGIDVNHDGIAWGVGLTLLFRGPVHDAAHPALPRVFFVSFGADFEHNI
jgi:hypothetical protein